MSTKTGRAPTWRIDADRGVEGEGDRDDLVARPDAERPEDGLLGHGAVGHEHGMADAAVFGPCRLERGRPRPMASMPDRRTSRTASSSAVPMSGLEIGIMRTSPPRRCSGRRDRDTGAAPRAVRRSGVTWRGARTPSASPRRRPQAQTQPIRRAGLPATSAWSGTSRVTTAPAPTVANRPTSAPATTTAPAPIEHLGGGDRVDRTQSSGTGQLAGGGDRPREPVVGEDGVGADEDAVARR